MTAPVPPADVVVVGGGVAGLVAALRLATGHPHEGGRRVVLVEADDRPGGKLRTGALLGAPLDLGPDAFLTRRPAAVALCQELGLGDDLVPPSAATAAVHARGRLRPLPGGLALGVPTDLGALARSGVVGPAGVARAALDLALPGLAAPAGLLEGLERGGADPTISEVVGRRLGREVVDALAGPLLGGINAGDPDQLSFAAAAPSLAALAAGKRSLLRALRPAAAPRRPAAPPAAPPGATVASRPPVFLGLRRGLGTLATALAAAARAAGVDLWTAAPATALRRTEGGYALDAGGRTVTARAVVLAVPAHAAATLLGGLCPEATALLGAIPYSSVATCSFAWALDAVPGRVGHELAAIAAARPPGPARADGDARAGGDARADLLPGSGFLVARPAGGTGGGRTGRLVTAATFTSTKWPHAVPTGYVAIRASVGRHGDDRHRSLDDDALAAAVAGELAERTGIDAAPADVVVQRWPEAFPQQLTGHAARCARARSALAGAAPGVVLAGAAYGGIGIPACIESGEAAAGALADALGR